MSDDKRHLLPITISQLRASRKSTRNINEEHKKSLSTLDRMALWITTKVGTMGFFLVIAAWTVIWCGYNIVASEFPKLHLTAFDPFPAFVAYLLISNVIQILLMPLIMVGQNLQGAHAELRAQNDFEINCKAELEVETILTHLEMQNAMLTALLDRQGIKQEAIMEMLAEQQKGAKAPEPG